MSSKIVNISKVDLYMKLLEPLDLNLKLELLNRLSDSIRKVVAASAVKESDSAGFFDELGSGWEDGITTEEVMKDIYESRQSNQTRPVSSHFRPS